MPKPPSDPRWRLATHGLDVIIFYGKNFPVDLILGNERFLVNFILAIAAKDDQIHPHQVGINRGSEDQIDCRSDHWILLSQRWNRFRCPSRRSLLYYRSITSTKSRQRR
jgi:hypothetical protein